MTVNNPTLYEIEAHIDGPNGRTEIGRCITAKENGLRRAIDVFEEIVEHPYVEREMEHNPHTREVFATVVDQILQTRYGHEVVFGEEVPHQNSVSYSWDDVTGVHIVPFDRRGEYLEVRVSPVDGTNGIEELNDLYRRGKRVKNDE